MYLYPTIGVPCQYLNSIAGFAESCVPFYGVSGSDLAPEPAI